MSYNHLNNTFEHLDLGEDNNIFFCSFILQGYEKNILGIEYIPRIINAAGLCICLEGEGEVVIEAQSYRVKKGDMCVVLPNNILHITKKSPDFKGYTIACTLEFLISVNVRLNTSVYLHIKENPCISLKEEEQKGLIKMCDLLKEHYDREDHPCREEVSRYLASAIIYEVIGIYKKGEPLKQQSYTRKNKLYLEFMQLVAKNFNNQRSIEFYSGKLCITSRYLSAVCKEISGMTAAECITQYVMINARILLSTTDMSILQISEELNFANASFFSQYFKKHEGITPKAYRAKSLFEIHD